MKQNNKIDKNKKKKEKLPFSTNKWVIKSEQRQTKRLQKLCAWNTKKNMAEKNEPKR